MAKQGSSDGFDSSGSHDDGATESDTQRVASELSVSEGSTDEGHGRIGNEVELLPGARPGEVVGKPCDTAGATSQQFEVDDRWLAHTSRRLDALRNDVRRFAEENPGVDGIDKWQVTIERTWVRAYRLTKEASIQGIDTTVTGLEGEIETAINIARDTRFELLEVNKSIHAAGRESDIDCVARIGDTIIWFDVKRTKGLNDAHKQAARQYHIAQSYLYNGKPPTLAHLFTEGISQENAEKIRTTGVEVFPSADLTTVAQWIQTIAAPHHTEKDQRN